MDGDDYITMPLAADTAGISITTLRQWVECGKLPATAGNRGRLVRLADVQRLMASEDISPGTRAATEDATVDQGSGAPAGVAPAARAGEHIAALQQLRAIDVNRVAFMARLDALYRAQVAAKDREIATKDEVIVELERRAERAERRATLLEQKLADLRAHAEVIEIQPVMPEPQPGLLRRIMSWYRQL